MHITTGKDHNMVVVVAMPYCYTLYAVFLPRDAMPVQYILSSCVCQKSLRRWLNLGSCRQYHTIGHDSSSLMPKISTKFQQGAK